MKHRFTMAIFVAVSYFVLYQKRQLLAKLRCMIALPHPFFYSTKIINEQFLK